MSRHIANTANLGESRVAALSQTPEVVSPQLVQQALAAQAQQGEGHGIMQDVVSITQKYRRPRRARSYGTTPGSEIPVDAVARAVVRQKSAARQRAAANRRRDAHGRFIKS